MLASARPQRIHRAVTGMALVGALVVSGCGTGGEERPAELPRTVWEDEDVPAAGVPRQLMIDIEAWVRRAANCRPAGSELVGPPDTVGDRTAVCGDEAAPVREIRMERRPFYTSYKVGGADDPELGETLQICPQRFRTFSPAMTLTLRRSDGSEVSQRVPPTDEALASDLTLSRSSLTPRSPSARSWVTARQGKVVAKTSLRVVAPRHRGTRVQQWLGRPRLPNPITIMVIGQCPRVGADRPVPEAGIRFRVRQLLSDLNRRARVGQVRARYGKTNNGQYLLRPRHAPASEGHDVEAHVPICVGCCESAPHQNAHCLR